jgi:hypothetical protein
MLLGGLDWMIVSLHATPPAIMRQRGALGLQRAQPEAIEAGAAGSDIGCKARIGCIALNPQCLLAADDAMIAIADCGLIFRKTIREGNSQPDQWGCFRRQDGSMRQKNHATYDEQERSVHNAPISLPKMSSEVCVVRADHH